MAIKNLSLQTIGLHVGFKDYSKLYPSQIPYTEAGVLTNSGVSIFGEGQSLPGDLATVLIGPPNPQSGVKQNLSLYILGNSFQLGNQTQVGDFTLTGNQKITGNITISGTMRAGFATWSSSIVATSKLFDIEHPSKGKGHRLAHASLEGPEIGVYYRGRLKSSNTIELPSYWKELVREDSITVQLQPIGNRHFHLNVTEFDNEKIIIAEADEKPIDCFYHVYGERKDVDRLTVEYQSDTIMEQGKPK